MRKFVIIFIEHLKLLFHPVIINAFVFFDKQKILFIRIGGMILIIIFYAR